MDVQEHEHLDFKAAKNKYSDEDLLRYCVAFANEGGGNLVLGVTDKWPRKVEGTQAFLNLDKIKEKILNHLKFRVDVFEIQTSEGRALTFGHI